MWVFLAAVVVVLRQATTGDADPSTVGRGRVLVGAIVAQGTLGYVQYAAGVPEVLVAAHVLGSVLVWVADAALPPRPHRARSRAGEPAPSPPPPAPSPPQPS